MGTVKGLEGKLQEEELRSLGLFVLEEMSRDLMVIFNISMRESGGTGSGVILDDPDGSHPTQNILWFYEIQFKMIQLSLNEQQLNEV